MDQHHNHQGFKHYCKICKKGFGCGRALGGHMRAHGIGGDADGHVEDGDPTSNWEDKPGKSPIKRMYALRTNPNRLKSCRVCENCGEEFTSWKSFLEHGKCTSDAESLVSGDDEVEAAAAEAAAAGAEGWPKGKRTERVAKQCNSNSNSSQEEDDLAANCLVMLASGRVDHRPRADRRIPVETEESCASATKEDPSSSRIISNDRGGFAVAAPRGFECKACKKVFNSHQALGGHRASHKKVKGCYAKVDEQEESYLEEDVITHDDYSITTRTKLLSQPPPQTMLPPIKKKPKVHECSICHRTFETGQALGGHKRCHWVTSNATDALVQVRNQRQRPTFHDQIDLNLPAPADEHAGVLEEERKVREAASYIHPSWLGMSPKTPVEDEVDSRVKIGKLGELKDISLGAGSSPWLQVGIGSSSND
ncbi:Zinc finger protein [Nymphaea thermarum]|nr:Zinc finger protein [Nymphaea thermarum]